MMTEGCEKRCGIKCLLGAAYEYAVYSECNAVYVLRGDIQSSYDFYFGLREGDPDTE